MNKAISLALIVMLIAACTHANKPVYLNAPAQYDDSHD
jgi:hypothetical protein